MKKQNLFVLVLVVVVCVVVGGGCLPALPQGVPGTAVCFSDKDCRCGQTCTDGLCLTGGLSCGGIEKDVAEGPSTDAGPTDTKPDVAPSESSTDAGPDTTPDEPSMDAAPDSTPDEPSTDAGPDTTPDAPQECVSGSTMVCYGGPSQTQGVGTCRAGVKTCTNGKWGGCVGEVKPAPETCDGKDNDCDGQIDEGLTRACYDGPTGTAGKGPCKGGTQTCVNGQWGTCQGQVLPATEACDSQGLRNGVDEDCDGQVDEGCKDCIPGFVQTCNVPGGKGECRLGKQICQPDGKWPACQAVRTPITEICGDGKDNDCDGTVDNGCP